MVFLPVSYPGIRGARLIRSTGRHKYPSLKPWACGRSTCMNSSCVWRALTWGTGSLLSWVGCTTAHSDMSWWEKLRPLLSEPFPAVAICPYLFHWSFLVHHGAVPCCLSWDPAISGMEKGKSSASQQLEFGGSQKPWLSRHSSWKRWLGYGSLKPLTF